MEQEPVDVTDVLKEGRGGATMKRTLAIAVGICVMGIVFTSLAYKEKDLAGSKMLGHASWVNPDGSHGFMSEGDNVQVYERSAREWVNPDGSRGTASASDRGPALAGSSVWMNPDGVSGTISVATDSGEPRRSTSVTVRARDAGH